MPAPEPGQKWAILGGTFDPVHLGHITLATEILKAQQLDGVLLIPAFDPPHRGEQPHATFQDRLAMLQLVCENEPRFVACPIEEELERPSYSLMTIRALKAKYQGVEFRFMIGADNLTQLKTWHRWETLLEEVRLLVGHRPGADMDAIRGYPPARIDIVETSMIDISSTDIRQTVRQGKFEDKLKGLVPSAVAEFIIRKGLYQ